MRALAREFKASLDLSDNQTELRLLPQPLYRYEPTPPGSRAATPWIFFEIFALARKSTDSQKYR
jgi:hypothetical protein